MTSVVSGVAISVLGTATEPLTGTELVPVVQGGATKQTTVQDIADLAGGADVDEATVQGRASGDGTGPVETLTEEQVSDLIWEDFGNSSDRRLANDVGYLTVPPTGISNRALTKADQGVGLLKTTSGTVTLTLPSVASDPTMPNGFVVTIACTHAAGRVDVIRDVGVTLINFSEADPDDDWSISGIGMATIWQIQPNTYGINGSGLV